MKQEKIVIRKQKGKPTAQGQKYALVPKWRKPRSGKSGQKK